MAFHISGLISGNDYQSMVDQLVEAQRIPIDNMQTEMDELDYDLGAWDALKTMAKELSDSLDTLRGYDLWRKMSVGTTDETVATATAATAAAEQSYTLTVSTLATAQSIRSEELDTTDDLITAGYVQENDIFSIEGVEITIEDGETLETLRTKINNASGDMADDLAVRATIINNHLVITRNETGSTSINLEDVSGSALEGLGILDAFGDILNESVEGKDAEFTINGISVTRSSNDALTDVVEGLTISLEGYTGTTTLSVHPDRDVAEEAILDFVEKYNEFASTVDEFSSITMASSSELAQTGELYGDTLINSIDRNIRSYVTSVKSAALVEGNAGYTYNGESGIMDSLADLGIWTDDETSQLVRDDEDRLGDMLEYNYDLVAQLFRGTYDADKIAYTNGIAADFYKYMDKISTDLTGDIAVRIETLSEKYDDLADEIEELEGKLDDYEQKQWNIFTNMEDALAEADSQLEYISSMFSSSS